MKEYPCELIRDLMPGVLDEVASPSSREAVKEHIAACPTCSNVYDAMRQEPKIRHANVQPVRFLQKVKRSTRWKVLTACVLAVILSLAVYLMLDGIFIDVPYNDIQVQNYYRLSDGRIVCAFTIKGLSANQCYINGIGLYANDQAGAKMETADQDFVISYDWWDRLKKPYNKNAAVFYVAMWEASSDPESSLYGLPVERLYYGFSRDHLLATRIQANALPATPEIEDAVKRYVLNPAIPSPPILP